MATYRFLTVWLLDAPIEKVWAVITDNQNLPTWWKTVKQAKLLESGDAIMKQGGQGRANFLGVSLVREEALMPDEDR